MPCWHHRHTQQAHSVYIIEIYVLPIKMFLSLAIVEDLGERLPQRWSLVKRTLHYSSVSNFQTFDTRHSFKFVNGPLEERNDLPVRQVLDCAFQKSFVLERLRRTVVVIVNQEQNHPKGEVAALVSTISCTIAEGNSPAHDHV